MTKQKRFIKNRYEEMGFNTGSRHIGDMSQVTNTLNAQKKITFYSIENDKAEIRSEENPLNFK